MYHPGFGYHPVGGKQHRTRCRKYHLLTLIIMATFETHFEDHFHKNVFENPQLSSQQLAAALRLGFASRIGPDIHSHRLAKTFDTEVIKFVRREANPTYFHSA